MSEMKLLNECPCCGGSGTMVPYGKKWQCTHCGHVVDFLTTVRVPDQVDIAMAKASNFVMRDTMHAMSGEEHGIIGGIIWGIATIFGGLILFAIIGSVLDATGISNILNPILGFIWGLFKGIFQVIAAIFGFIIKIPSYIKAFFIGTAHGVLAILKFGLIIGAIAFVIYIIRCILKKD